MRYAAAAKKSGYLIVKKPAGMTSHDVVDKVRRRYEYKRVGHAGTLDPLAEGVLVLGVGRGATRCLSKFSGQAKEYVARMALGVTTDTLDSTGTVMEKKRYADVSRDLVVKALDRFMGVQEQIPPMFSAVKYRGKPLYKLARKGRVVPRKARSVHIYEIELLDFTPPEVSLRVVCSKGTYIRTLCADIGAALGCGAHLTGLVRTRSGRFGLDDAVPLDQLLEYSNAAFEELLIPVEGVD
jgi:tRNA pseudouridine55 synthase